MSDPHPATPFGPYRLIRRLGQGGMGDVWLAEETASARYLVIKRIHASLATQPELRLMFLDEARIAARLVHPNCVEIFDLGDHEGCLYIAMAHVAGRDLQSVRNAARKAQTPVPHALALHAVAQACDGLHYAHELRDAEGVPLEIVHRDVSPQNILVTYEGVVKIIDFGIAKAADRASITRTGALKGKIPYMAAEQIRQDRVDRRADVYALGVVLYELTTGKRPFVADSEFALMTAIQRGDLEPPSRRMRDYPPQLEAVVLRALARDPGARFQTAGDLAGSLRAALSELNLSPTTADLGTFVQGLPDPAAAPARAQASRTPTPTSNERRPAVAAASAAIPVSPPPKPAPNTGRRWGVGVGAVGGALGIAALAAVVGVATGAISFEPDTAAASPDTLPSAILRTSEAFTEVAAEAEDPVPAVSQDTLTTYRRVMALASRNEHADAATLLEEALERDPSQALLHRALGDTRKAMAQNSGAIAAYRRFIELDPSNPDASLIADRIERLTRREQARRRQRAQAATASAASATDSRRSPPATEAQAAFQAGFDHHQRGEFRQAVSHLERAIRLDPVGNSTAHALLGNCYSRFGDSARAASHYRKFLETNPNHRQAPQVRQILEEYDRYSQQ